MLRLSVALAGMLTLAVPVRAQSVAPDATAKAPVTSPAPVPAIPPPTPQTGASSVPPEIVSPAARPGGAATASGPPNATPFSGAPLVPGTGRQSPGAPPTSGSAAPPLSR